MRQVNGFKKSFALFACFFITLTQAQDYPIKPITLIVPFAPGGGSDLVSRVVANELSKGLGQRVVIENKAGAGGNIGFAAGSRAAPDGYTLTTITQNITVNPHVLKEMPFDPLKDLQPISLMVQYYSMLVLSPSLPVQNVAELVAYGKANPGVLTGGHGGVGGQAHLSMVLIASAAGFKMEYIPYKGEAPVLPDLMAGRTSMTVQSFGGLGQHVDSGRLRAIGVTSPTRVPQFPKVPTIGETLPGFQLAGWYGIAVPAGTPAPIVKKLNDQMKIALNAPEVKKALTEMGLVVSYNTPEEFSTLIKDDYRRIQKVVAETGIKPQ